MIVFQRTANKARIVVEKMTWFLSLTWASNLSPVSTSCYWPCCSVYQTFSGWIPSCARTLTCTHSHTDLQTFPAGRQRMRLRTEVVSCLKMKTINSLRLRENNLRFNKVCYSNLLFLYFFIFHSYGKCSVLAVVILFHNLPEIINQVYSQCFCVREFLHTWNACVIFVPGWPKPRLYLAVAVKILWIPESGTEHKAFFSAFQILISVFLPSSIGQWLTLLHKRRIRRITWQRCHIFSLISVIFTLGVGCLRGQHPTVNN